MLKGIQAVSGWGLWGRLCLLFLAFYDSCKKLPDDVMFMCRWHCLTLAYIYTHCLSLFHPKPQPIFRERHRCDGAVIIAPARLTVADSRRGGERGIFQDHEEAELQLQKRRTRNNDTTEICQVADSPAPPLPRKWQRKRRAEWWGGTKQEGKSGRHMMHIANVVCCQFPVVAAAILFMHEHECDCNCNCSKKKAKRVGEKYGKGSEKSSGNMQLAGRGRWGQHVRAGGPEFKCKLISRFALG